MEKTQYQQLKFDHALQAMADQELFAQWLRNFFYLNSALHKEYDAIYQSSFYVVFYELVTVGLDYAKDVFGHVKKGQNQEKKDFYAKLIEGLGGLKLLFSESEFEFIEYKRHSAGHIFQTQYQKRFLNNGTIKTKRKGKLIDVLNAEFQDILIKQGFDRGFDTYMTRTLYPKVTDLYQELEKLKAEHPKSK